MNIKTESLRNIGVSLVGHAEASEFTAQRGVMDEMFPFIFAASRRMSARAISRWLMEKHKIKLSAVTIAKALREQKLYWEAMFEKIEPAARIFAEAHDVTIQNVLLEETDFEFLKTQTPSLAISNHNQGHVKMDEYDTAVITLQHEWFSFDDATRKNCFAYIRFPEEQVKKNKKSMRAQGGKRRGAS